ncbi:MAG: hypothetical protein WC223_10555 [Bacteroidales bacterium]|jgi:hypothetical protein
MPIPIIPLVIIFGGAAVIKNMLSTANVGDKVQVQPENLKLNFTWKDGLTIKTDLRLQNPTKNSVTITQPYVKLFDGNKLLGSNTIKSNTTKINKLSEAVLKDVTFKVSLLQLGINLSKMATNLIEGEQILKGYNLKLEYSLYANGIPVTSIQPIKVS